MAQILIDRKYPIVDVSIIRKLSIILNRSLLIKTLKDLFLCIVTKIHFRTVKDFEKKVNCCGRFRV